LGLLDLPDSGSVAIEGADSQAMRSVGRDEARCRDIGFVFQFYHLLPELNVLENTLMPAMTGNGIWGWIKARRDARKRAIEMLERFGLGHRLKHRPRELSGGECQRVAIARALINSPKLLLADEPTGNLDSATGGQIIKALRELNASTRQTIILVTHDESIAALAGRTVRLRDGKLV
jgi:lipoprotein-releasing system ATP-binding protein